MTGILLLTGCGSGKEDSVKSIKIGVTLYDQYDTFISELMQTFKSTTLKKESEKGVAISLEILDASGNQTTQNEQVRTLIEKGCDVICVNLVDRTEPTTITDMAEKNNIPIIFFNRELVAEDLERWSKLYYVGADAFDSGRLEGALAADAFLTDATMDKNQDGICPVCCTGGRGRTSGCDRADRMFGKYAHRVRCAGRKARLCDCQLEPGTGTDKGGFAADTVPGTDGVDSGKQ